MHPQDAHQDHHHQLREAHDEHKLMVSKREKENDSGTLDTFSFRVCVIFVHLVMCVHPPILCVSTMSA